MPLIETLYKTNAPEQLERAEYYQPRVEQKFHGKWRYTVTETHAWYDDAKKEVVHKGDDTQPGSG